MEKENILKILNKYNAVFDENFQDTLTKKYNLYFDLFNYYMSEMPYGTAKCRDGDPFLWIENRLKLMLDN